MKTPITYRLNSLSTALCVITMLMVLTHSSDAQNTNAMNQLTAPIEWIKVPNTDDLVYMAQRTPSAKLILTPNESFFPKLGLRAEGKGAIPDNDLKLNKGSSFAFITQWDTGDQAEWGIWIETPGEIQIQIEMAQTRAGDQFTLAMANQAQTFAPSPTTDGPQQVANFSLGIDKPGRYSLFFTCKTKAKNSKPRLHTITLTGDAIHNSAVLRKRWRPAAAHTRFSSSQNPENIRLWIMEMDAVPGDLDFYSPVTTPFGYYGSSWLADGTVKPRMNFSLWSYGRNKPEPPVDQLSHLIAIGNPDAEFGHFGHEGTGVKVRGWDPLEGKQKQVYALRVEPGKMYDTYFSYFFNQDESRWHLYSVGKKYNQRKPLESLWVGSFVEVPGRAAVQRTGAYERKMRYRGWIVNKEGKLYPLDRMRVQNINKETGLTHTDRGITDDGRFYLQTGGWIFRKGTNQEAIALLQTDAKVTEPFLAPSALAFLQTIPSAITGTKIQRTPQGTAISFDIRNLGTDSQVELYWGYSEGLTLVKRWQNKVTVEHPLEGRNTFTIPETDPNKSLFVRLFLKNSQGQFWSMDTLKTGAN